GYQDPTGLYHYAARYYDPNIGRFTQPDPSGQEKNPYLYAEGDPVNRIDPNGLWSWQVGVEVCAGVCLGGGYARDDAGEGGGFFNIGVGSPGLSGGFEGSTGDASAGPSAYGKCAAGFGTLGGQLAQGGSLALTGGLGTKAATPMCSGGLQVQF
ncbi:RHS repeat-associated core domain-containing protein, partial [Streptomyces sp. NPDC096193]|uniref:RHS repeat-associated core domain-containing protein n=1 Tax=Streptomyces sp. NPDC096193 TaxID=3155821 RepID=UPI0033310CA4